MKPTAKTPLTGAAQQRTSSLFGHALIFVMVPWFMFIGTLVAFFYLYHMPQGESVGMLAVSCVVGAELFFCCFLLLSRKQWVRQLGQMALAIVLAGVLAGMYNEYTNMVYYHKYKALNEYSNVLPTASIMSILDGAVLYFSSSTVIDTQRASAFKSYTSPGTTFCVAPVLDDTFVPTDSVGIWAVGTNCCGNRASFFCDDSDDGSTKSGVVLLPADEVLPPWLIDIGFGANSYSDYEAAIKLASAYFGTSVAREVRLVHWVKDTHNFIENFRRAGIAYLSEAAQLVLGILFVSVLLLVASGHQV